MKLFVDDLTHVDFSYLDPQRGLVGESWAVRLELDGTVNDEGMICDFGVVKKRAKSWFDAGMDHSLVVPLGMPGLSVSESAGRLTVDWTYPNGERFYCEGPAEAFYLFELDEITAEEVAQCCKADLMELFPDEVQGLELSLYPETITGAYYHYSHGLQKHQGNCQRIAHGHRSPLKIYIDGERDLALETRWSETFRDIYIGSREHLVEEKEGRYYFAYDAPQGHFALSLPQSRCYLIDSDSTIELIGKHLCDRTQRDYPMSRVEVRAYEGIGKGSISISDAGL